MKQATEKRSKVNWQEKLPILKQGIAEGKTAAKIAVEIGCSIQSVHNARYHYLDCRKVHKGWTAKEVSILKDMYFNGSTAWQIAAVLNRTLRSVECMKGRLKITKCGQLN